MGTKESEIVEITEKNATPQVKVHQKQALLNSSGEKEFNCK